MARAQQQQQRQQQATQGQNAQTPTPSEAYLEAKKEFKKENLKRIKALLEGWEKEADKSKIRLTLPIEEIDIVVQYRGSVAVIENLQYKCKTIREKLAQPGLEQSFRDTLSVELTRTTATLNDSIKRFNRWMDSVQNPSSNDQVKDIVNRAVSTMQAYMIMEQRTNRHSRRKDRVMPSYLVPSFEENERNMRFVHYRKYAMLCNISERAIEKYEEYKKAYKTGTQIDGRVITKDDVKKAEAAKKAALAEMKKYGSRRDNVVPPSKNIYGEIRVTESRVLNTKCGALCKLLKKTKSKHGVLLDYEKYQGIDELAREIPDIALRIGSELRNTGREE